MRRSTQEQVLRRRAGPLCGPACGPPYRRGRGALPTMELWADSITAVLDELGSSEAVLISYGAVPTSALFAATHPSRTTALVVLEGSANPMAERIDGPTGEQIFAAMVARWGTGEWQHATNPDMPWNEEIRAATARWERGAASPGTVALMLALSR